jgi:hypothetical protein
MLPHLDELKNSEEYQNYLYVRERVKKMMVGNKDYVPSQYWQEELSNFDYMIDASPLIIHKLRHHTYHITGLKVYDYRSHQAKSRNKMCDKLDSLMKMDNGELFVQESKKMGGFGYDYNGFYFNLDTLKYYESLIALDKKKILNKFKDNSKKKVVWEIGGGWGGFAYQFKTLFDNVTYIVVDLPEVILFSALYLKTMFPEKKLKIVSEFDATNTLSNWMKYDFIFISPIQLGSFEIDRIDLLVNMVSFQEMTSNQVDAYVAKAVNNRCPHLYSLNRKRSKYNPEIKNVNAILSKYYDLETVKVLDVSYNYFAADADKKPSRSIGKKLRDLILSKDNTEIKKNNGMLPYQHVIGTLKNARHIRKGV